MLIIRIDKSSPRPLYKQIIEEIKTLIDQGTIKSGKPLPSTRDLANKLGINRSTVYEAYAELQALGYLHSRPGSYNIVQKRLKEVIYNPERRSAISWEEASQNEAKKLYKTFSHYSPEGFASGEFRPQAISLSALDPDSRLFPVIEFRRCVNQVLRSLGSKSMEYGDHKGYRLLREYIAQRSRLHGISVSAEEILITNGAQQAIDLTARLLGGPGKKVVIEAPTYANVIPLFEFHGMEILGIPMRENGMDLRHLEKVLDSRQVSFVYTIPNFQNPTGITTSHHHREKLLEICLKRRVPIVEDGFEEDMKYFGKVPLPIKSIDEKNIVIYIGTFSKALFPGLRIGWITADKECIERMTAIKRFSDLSSGNLVQMVIYLFCKEGYYDLHLRRLHRIFRRRMQVALATIKECFPRAVTWTYPLGGYTIWVKIPKKMPEAKLHKSLLPYSVLVSPGEYYFPDQKASEYFRISIARLNEEEIRQGLLRLGKALHSLC